MRSFIAATLISAVAAETYTAWSTKVESVISCGPEVTNCPGSSTAWVKPTPTPETTCTEETASAKTPATWTSTWETKKTSTVHVTVSTSVPAGSPSGPASAPATYPAGSPSGPASAPATYPAGGPSTWATTGTWATTTGAWGAQTTPVAPKYTTPAGPAPYASGKASGSWGASSWSKAIKPTGTGSWSSPSSTPSVVAYKGAASSVNAAGFLAGAGAVLAFLL